MKLYKSLLALTIIIATLIVMTSPINAAFTVTPPQGLGTIHTYTVWDKINWGWGCRDLINYCKERNALSNTCGIVTYGRYFAGALTTTYGKVGDMLLVVEEGNIVYPVIMADAKNQNDYNCTKWGHQNGRCIVEFEILSSARKSLYGNSGGYISDLLAKPVIKVINLGSVYENSYYFMNPEQACRDYGLSGCFLLFSPYAGYIVT